MASDSASFRDPSGTWKALMNLASFHHNFPEWKVTRDATELTVLPM